MTDLVKIQSAVLDRLKQLLEIESFEDVERLLLRGQGLSPNSYRTYLQAVRQMYDYTEGLNPLQWSVADIEGFYDSVVERTSHNTAYNRIAGLKNFCKQISHTIPGWENPFDAMNEALRKKLATNLKAETKTALTRKEISSLMALLNEDTSLKGLQNRALVLTLLTTGLRAAEACSLTYESLEHDSDADIWTLTGIGKGMKPFCVEIHPDAVKAIRKAFRAMHKRSLKPGDHLLYTTRGRMKKPAMWTRLRDLGDILKTRGEVRQSVEFSAHLFRRTFLTQLSKLGMGVRAIQHHSRHSNVETLMDHYIDDTESTRPYLDKLLVG